MHLSRVPKLFLNLRTPECELVNGFGVLFQVTWPSIQLIRALKQNIFKIYLLWIQGQLELQADSIQWHEAEHPGVMGSPQQVPCSGGPGIRRGCMWWWWHLPAHSCVMKLAPLIPAHPGSPGFLCFCELWVLFLPKLTRPSYRFLQPRTQTVLWIYLPWPFPQGAILGYFRIKYETQRRL